MIVDTVFLFATQANFSGKDIFVKNLSNEFSPLVKSGQDNSHCFLVDNVFKSSWRITKYVHEKVNF